MVCGLVLALGGVEGLLTRCEGRGSRWMKVHRESQNGEEKEWMKSVHS